MKNIECPGCHAEIAIEYMIGMYPEHYAYCSANRPIAHYLLEDMGGKVTFVDFIKNIFKNHENR